MRPFPDHAGSWPPGSLFSNCTEFARLIVALMDRGKLDGVQVLPEPVARRLLTPVRKVEMMGVDWGWGAFHRREGEHIVFMPGGRAGFGSSFYLIPGRRIGAVAMTNLSGVNFRSFAQAAVNVLVPAEPRKPAPPAPALPMSIEEMQRYAGSYVNGPMIRTELAVRDGRLQVVAGGRLLPVEKTGEGEFRAPGGAQLERFRIKMGPDGRPRFLLAEAWALKKTDR
jgi:CubicO group peptidase (beta-lactamase class C family)